MAEKRGDDGDRCPTAPLTALSFSTKSSAWRDATTKIDTNGIVTDLGVGSGDHVIGITSDGRPASGLVLIDVGNGTVTPLKDSGVAGGTVCASGDTFVSVATGSTDTSSSGAATMASGPGATIDPAKIALVDGHALVDAHVSGSDLPQGPGSVSAVGCADGRAVVQAANSA